ncbi:histone acetyltransferase HTATIP [Nematocida sp. LUAm3]|nr:histone acetyltransferase HTATIP [Nematocida sp. LUAm3]KAI5175177.1 histone acetyltransferase HTATIP [Nematocida sp. LUAm2]KAI5178151.1 histone acetyltransferase HTATIP [Nematocida sp. LUAm1]
MKEAKEHKDMRARVTENVAESVTESAVERVTGDVVIGCKVPVKEDPQRIVEIIAIKEAPLEYYIHYVGYNKRLDRWVPPNYLDLSNQQRIEYPKKKKIPPKKEESKQHTSQALSTEEIYKVKNIESIEIGEYTLNAWYFSPYPYELSQSKRIVICEFCLFYFKDQSDLLSHFSVCRNKRPPGRQIYRKEGISFFEVDGSVHVNYSRNLSLLSKLFLDHKTLYYDIELFFFYVMCSYDITEKEENRKYTTVGYFSKEKESQHGYNVACVLILPQHQRKGYGRVLIDFSYLLSKRERVAASPEKPLSDLGLLSYRRYWIEKIAEILVHSKNVSISDIRDMSSITTDDILHTLQTYKVLMFYNGTPAFILREDVLQIHEKSVKRIRLDPEYLTWAPSYH